MEFVNPPEPKKKNNTQHWITVVKELRENKDKWGLVGNYSVGVSTHIKQGRYPAFYPDRVEDKLQYMTDNWEVTTRSTSPSRVDVYVRFIGES